MPIYSYQNPNTKEVFEVLRSFKDWDKPYILEDGTKCKRVFDYRNIGVIDKNAEVFQKDPDYVKKCKPKYIKYKDGHREKYDPTRHC